MIQGEQYRGDIQALRGLAVLLVLLYHAGVSPVTSGFLGVDIFFVISGFLITGIVSQALDRGTFSFKEFYARRARRLLPAAWVVLSATTVLAAYLLTATRYQEFLYQLLGASLFIGNVTAWQQTGYFATDAVFNPLLHMWSLAIEEQYYLLIPLLLWIVPARWRLRCIVTIVLASLALCLWLASQKPSIAFFMLPTRAWELGIGSIGAMLAANPASRVWSARLLPLALATLIAVPLLPVAGPHPGMSALAVCVATLGVLLARDSKLPGIAAVRGLAVVGNCSYSLYLVHWPLFAMARTAYLGKDLPLVLTIVLVLLSLGLAFALFRFVEEPVRHARIAGWRLLVACTAAFAITLAAAYSMGPTRETAVRATGLLAPVTGLPGAACKGDRTVYQGECRQEGGGGVLLWGDSYSMHLVPGLLSMLNGPLTQASLGQCSPLLDYAGYGGPNERSWAQACIGFTDSVLEYIRRTPAIHTVVISARYGRTLESQGKLAIARTGGQFVAAPIGLAPTIAAQQKTIAAIRALGRRVVVVSATPPNGIDLGQCWERTSQQRRIFGEHADCIIRRTDAEQDWAEMDALHDAFERVAQVPVIRLDRALCAEGICKTQDAGLPLFKDTGHLSAAGSEWVGRKLDLGRLVESTAR